MSRLEEELRSALHRQEVPNGFADRVLARAAGRGAVQSKAPRALWLEIFSRPLVRWATALALCLVLVAGGVHYRNVQRERAEGEAAKQRLMLALRIAGSKLQLARSKVNGINADQTENQQEKE